MLSHYTGLPLPLHPTFPSSQPLQKDNNPFALHYHPCLLMNALPVSHSHYPSPCTTTLASLVKGRWLDGTTQTVALLRPACDMSVLFILQTFLPSRRRDCLSCIDPLHPHNHCKKTIVPCSAPHSCHMNALLVSHPCETLGVQLRASMPVPCQR